MSIDFSFSRPTDDNTPSSLAVFTLLLTLLARPAVPTERNTPHTYSRINSQQLQNTSRMQLQSSSPSIVTMPAETTAATEDPPHNTTSAASTAHVQPSQIQTQSKSQSQSQSQSQNPTMASTSAAQEEQQSTATVATAAGQEQQQPPNSPPLPTRHTAQAPGPRASRFQDVLDSTLAHTLAKISWDNFAACYPTIAAQSKPGMLRAVQRQMVERLGALCKVCFFFFFFWCLVLVLFLK